MEKNWLDTALDMLEFAPNDVMSVTCIRWEKATPDEVDIVAQLVGLCYRSGHEEIGKRIYTSYRSRFQEHKSEFCVLASTWPKFPLVGVKDTVLFVLTRCKQKGREKVMGMEVYRMYSKQLTYPFHADYEMNTFFKQIVAVYRQLSINDRE
jgi:hypothetical protein